MWVKVQTPDLGRNIFNRFVKNFRNGTGPLYPGLRCVACNGGVQPGLPAPPTSTKTCFSPRPSDWGARFLFAKFWHYRSSSAPDQGQVDIFYECDTKNALKWQKYPTNNLQIHFKTPSTDWLMEIPNTISFHPAPTFTKTCFPQELPLYGTIFLRQLPLPRSPIIYPSCFGQSRRVRNLGRDIKTWDFAE
jgi:hypothetical protein